VRRGQLPKIIQAGGHLVEATQELLQQVPACLRPRRLHLATRCKALLKIAPQRIADLAHLAADGVDLGLAGVHLGCHEVRDGNLKDGSAAIDWGDLWPAPELGLLGKWDWRR
jgi:hypothetical protein